jgi:DNA-binding transcriptional LysR family regulator
MKSIIIISDINIVNFRNFDLNLLRVLDAMLALRNTTRVAEVIGLTQPAVSAALSRLRDTLADPLFIREGNVLVPTAYATSLAEPVHSALLGLEQALAGKPHFDPAGSERSFTIGCADYFSEMLMPQLAEAVGRKAPRVLLKMLPADLSSIPAQLAAERSDLVISIPLDMPDWVEKTIAFQASEVVVARTGHPVLGGIGWGAELPLDLISALPHAMFSVTGSYRHFADDSLARMGRERHVTVSVPSYYGVGRIVAQTDLIGFLPARFALSIAARLGLMLYRLPFPMELTKILLYWHKRQTSDPEQAWFRTEVLDLLSRQDETRYPLSKKDFEPANAVAGSTTLNAP